ncbi:ribonuclease E/G [Caloramator sp. CAR-1]|uniref:ribonuclease E/G n=1 Tax=Caloramator sp. CAR-1 TaxID=3062777 RepID=UPI0026E13A61|nr:ribonuclease E/G [Caloramator sp. CAR-1]MDO6355348.1 ribonuclease E/G [Caloramator sp. CAR-1]
MKKIFVDTGITQNRFLVFEDEELIDIYIEDISYKKLEGNIYKARVENINAYLNIAFLNIGEIKNAFIDLKEAPNLKIGDEIIVQIKRDSEGKKAHKASSRILFPGKKLHLLVGIKDIKSPNKEIYKKIKSMFENNIKENYGVLVEAEEFNTEELINEYHSLIEKWENIKDKANYIKAPCLLMKSKDYISKLIDDHINGKESIELYFSKEKDKSLFQKYIDVKNFNVSIDIINTIDNCILDTMKRKHFLIGEANIVMDEVEAFTIIDVNSGNIDYHNAEIKSLMEFNKLAAQRIFRLLKLRNTGGIIFIDFVDVENKQKQELLNFIMELSKNDNNISRIYGWTKLGVLELARARKGKKLKELIYYDYYKDILNPSYVLKLIENKCLYNKEKFFKKEFVVSIPQTTFELSEKIGFKDKLKKEWDIELKFLIEPNVINYEFKN